VNVTQTCLRKSRSTPAIRRPPPRFKAKCNVKADVVNQRIIIIIIVSEVGRRSFRLVNQQGSLERFRSWRSANQKKVESLGAPITSARWWKCNFSELERLPATWKTKKALQRQSDLKLESLCEDAREMIMQQAVIKVKSYLLLRKTTNHRRSFADDENSRFSNNPT